MRNRLNSDSGNELGEQLAPIGQSVLQAIDECRFSDARNLVLKVYAQLDTEKAKPAGEEFLNDVYRIRTWFHLLSDYSEIWERIEQQQCAKSWVSLQNALDCVRAIKRLSEIDVQFWEDQLQNLEAAYPYKVFFSMGAVASRIDCSICGLLPQK